MKRIVLAMDFGDASVEALRYAAALAQTRGAALEIAHVVPDPAEEPWSDELSVLTTGDITERWLRNAQARLRALARQYRPLRVDVAVRLGSVAHQLLEHLADSHPDLVAIGIANAEHAQLPTIGLIAERLLRKAPCPVLAVPASHGESANGALTGPWPRNILVATDFSAPARGALPCAWDLAQQTDAVVQVLHVNDTLWNEGPVCGSEHVNAIDEVKRQLEDEIAAEQTRSGMRRLTYPLLASGEPAREILACADRIAADVIVMGTHGRSQVGRFLLGSVTQEVLEHTVRPVLVTGPANEGGHHVGSYHTSHRGLRLSGV